jgi:hypothetical protein
MKITMTTRPATGLYGGKIVTFSRPSGPQDLAGLSTGPGSGQKGCGGSFHVCEHCATAVNGEPVKR